MKISPFDTGRHIGQPMGRPVKSTGRTVKPTGRPTKMAGRPDPGSLPMAWAGRGQTMEI